MEAVTGRIIKRFGWTRVSREDEEILERQLGRRPREVYAVARRCRHGKPQVIVNYPLPRAGSSGTEETSRPDAPDGSTAADREVFPTLFWLTCPYLVSAVDALESAGWIGRLKEEYKGGGEDSEALVEAHRAHARLRLSVCDPHHVEHFRREHPKQYAVLAQTGIGGVRRPDGVKCLHAHLADYLARTPAWEERWEDSEPETGGPLNPIGRKTAAMLLGRGIDLKGDAACASCTVCSEKSRSQAAKVEGVARAEEAEQPKQPKQPQSPRRIASVDLGSNSARFFLCDLIEGQSGNQPDRRSWDFRLRRISAGLRTTRLARGVERTGRLDGRSIEDTLGAVRAFAAELRKQGAETVVAAATSAVRDARDGSRLLVRIFEETGISVPVISGEEEASLSFLGAVRGLDRLATPGNLVVLDIGGGSTELIWGSPSGEMRDRMSLPMGAVRMTERLIHSDPVDADDMAQLIDTVDEILESELPTVLGRPGKPSGEAGASEPVFVVAVGGTATTVAAIFHEMDVYDPERAHGTQITVGFVDEIIRRMAAMPVDERREIRGLQPERADIILAGAVILRRALLALGADECLVSDSDILQGLIWRLVEGIPTN